MAGEQNSGDHRDFKFTNFPQIYDVVKIDGRFAQVLGTNEVYFLNISKKADPKGIADILPPQDIKLEEIEWENYVFIPSPYKTVRQLVDSPDESEEFSDVNFYSLKLPDFEDAANPLAAESRLNLKYFGEYYTKN